MIRTVIKRVFHRNIILSKKCFYSTRISEDVERIIPPNARVALQILCRNRKLEKPYFIVTSNENFEFQASVTINDLKVSSDNLYSNSSTAMNGISFECLMKLLNFEKLNSLEEDIKTYSKFIPNLVDYWFHNFTHLLKFLKIDEHYNKLNENEKENFKKFLFYAFTHSSVPNNKVFTNYLKNFNIHQVQDYNCLEFIGDRAIYSVLAKYLYTTKNMDKISNLENYTRSITSNAKFKKHFINSILPNFIITDKSFQFSAKAYADFFESVIGAIYIAFGENVVLSTLLDVFDIFEYNSW